MAAKKSAGAKPVSGTRATKKAPAKTASAKSASKKMSATKAAKPVKAAKAVNGTAKKAAARKSEASVTAKPVTKTATKVAVKKTTTGKAAAPTKATTKAPPKATLTTPPKKAVGKTKTPFTKVELREFGKLIDSQLRDLQAEYDVAMIALDDLQHNRLDTAGDDPADAGNKTFEREQEMSIANNRMHLITQLQRARDRVDEGSYGLCENCGKTIPKARLQAYPSATLCVDCKAREERR